MNKRAGAAPAGGAKTPKKKSGPAPAGSASKAGKPDLFKKCIQRVLKDVVFANSVVFDRIENCGGCLMALIAVDLDFFSRFVREYVAGLGAGVEAGVVQQQQQQVLAGFEGLVVIDVINNGIFGKGVALRTARNTFKQRFELFAKELSAFITCL